MSEIHSPARRRFLQTAACVAAGAGFSLAPLGEREAWSSENDLHIVGPKPGYAPQLGTLASMMAFMRNQVVHSVAGMKQADLDFLLDAKANTIGALLLHLAATETYYQELDFYLTTLQQTRDKTLAEFKKRDDKWLFAIDDKWPWGPTNNYCKWFHVCEHEANHNGQIKFLKGRLPT